MGDMSRLGAVAAGLALGEPAARGLAARALGDLKAVEYYVHLADAVSDSSVRVREDVAYGLAEMGDERAVEPLRSLLDDSSDYVRARALVGLARIGAPALDAIITTALADNSNVVRVSAVAAMLSVSQRSTGGVQ